MLEVETRSDFGAARKRRYPRYEVPRRHRIVSAALVLAANPLRPAAVEHHSGRPKTQSKTLAKRERVITRDRSGTSVVTWNSVQ